MGAGEAEVRRRPDSVGSCQEVAEEVEAQLCRSQGVMGYLERYQAAEEAVAEELP